MIDGGAYLSAFGGTITNPGMSKPARITRTEDTTSVGSPRRQQVIDAAAATFARHGYHGVGTRAIADTLGIKAASLYCHVASKEDALEQVCSQGIGLSVRHLREAIASAPDIAGRVRTFFAVHQGDFREYGDFMTVYLNERRHLPPDALARTDAISRQFRSELDAMFAEAQSRGELHPDITARSASLIMIGTMRNLSQLYFEGPIKGFEAFAKVAVEAMIRAIAAPK